MKIQILQLTRESQALGSIGDIVTVDAPTGNRLASIGQVVVIEHDVPKRRSPKAKMTATPQALEHLERETGKPFKKE